MLPSKEYLEAIASKLERLNPGMDMMLQIRKEQSESSREILGRIGNSSSDYLKNKKDPGIKPDPLFPDRNTY
jgi:hypothetical protein